MWSRASKLKCNPQAEPRPYAARFGNRPLASDLKFWSSLRWMSTDRRVLALALSMEAARALSSHSLAYASKSAASRGDNIPATRRACPARARHSIVSDKPNFVTMRITVSQVATCWRRGVKSSMLVIIPESSPHDRFLIDPRPALGQFVDQADGSKLDASEPHFEGVPRLSILRASR